MAEEWLKHLVHEIKDKDRTLAAEAAKSGHEHQLIQEEGPALWRAFGDFLGKYVEDMKADFGDDITLREGALAFSFIQGNQITISKSAFPHVTFTATPQYQQRTAAISYVSCNPKPQAGRNIGATPMPCRFEIGDHEKIYLLLDGKPFHEAHEAAKHIIEKLFTIAD